MKREDQEDFVIEVINILRDNCYKNAKNKGFWEDEDEIIGLLIPVSDDSLYTADDIRTSISQIERIKERIISLFNAEKVALEHSELSERLETLRKDPTKVDEHCPELLNIEIECADLIIRCLDFCGRRNLRIGEALIAKMKYNEGREFKHGKHF